MTIHNEAFFESPTSSEAPHYSPESEHEMEFEFEDEMMNHFGSPEMFHASHEYELEDESDRFLGELINTSKSMLSSNEGETSGEMEYEDEDELFGSPETSQEYEYEDEANALLGFTSEGEYEYEAQFSTEADAFFGKALKKLAKVAVPLAKRIAPIAARTLVGMIPGVGAAAGPLAGKLVRTLVSEAEMEVAEMENHFTNLFASGEPIGEAENPIAHEAALTELLAAEAALASTEAEAEADLAAALPITITIMGARRPLRRVVPILTQANTQLVKTLRRQGPIGRQLLRTVPSIQRRTVAALRRAARSGQPITAPLAIRTMATVAGRTLNNPQQVQRAIVRNAALRVRTAPKSPARAMIYSPNKVKRNTRPTMRRRVAAEY